MARQTVSTIPARTEGMERREGFLPVYWDAEAGALVLEVEATPLLMRDVTGGAAAVCRAELGELTLDESRSAPVAEACKAFPRNTELEVALTFTGDKLAAKLEGLLADGSSLTVRQHHSFMALPEPGFHPREMDPRVGFGFITFKDFAAPWDGRLERQLAKRWRLA